MEALKNLEYNEIVFPKLNIDITVNSTAFTIFDIDIQWYGILITCGIILAMLFAFSQMKKYGLDADKATDVIIAGIFGGIIGARTYYVILEWDSYAGDIKKILDIRSGGLAIYGGIIGSLLFALITAKIKKVKILPLLDLTGMGFLIGQCIGRWGNFFNHEAFGCNTTSIFGMSSGKIQQWIQSNSATLSKGVELSADLPVHPCFLYESVWCLLGFIVLFLVSKHRKFDGQIFLLYFSWYCFGRFFLEGLRTDSLMLGNIRFSQMLSAIAFVTSVILSIVFTLKVKRMGSDYVLYCDTEESKKMLAEAEQKIQDEKKKKQNKAKHELKPEKDENYTSILQDDDKNND